MQATTKIRRSGGSTVTAVPPEFINVLGLEIGDTMFWNVGRGKVTIEFYKAVSLETPAQEMPQGETAADAA
jgi:antitoxin component of MazEF toxin-antitoxin module